MSAKGTLRALPNRDGTVRWVLYFREKGKPDATVRCTAYNRPEDRPKVEAWADDIRRIRIERDATKARPETVSDWYGRYYDARGGESVNDARARYAKWIAPVIGDLPIAKVTRDHIEKVVAMLDAAIHEEKIAWKTAANIWSEVTAPFNVAATAKDRSLRVLSVNPAEGVEGPDKGLSKSKPFLRPEEVIKLLTCPRVKLHRRRLYAVAIYTALRQGELRALRAGDVDLDTMQITVARQAKGKVEKSRTKTGRARVVSIEPNLVPLLRVLIDGKRPEQRILRMPVGSNHLATMLRRDLNRAGCTREALHVSGDDEMRAPMRFHNLRDTCLTHMAVRRDPPQDVQWRAGHTTAAMTEKYIANARYEAGPNFGAPLPPLPAALFPDGVPEPEPTGSDDVIVDVIEGSEPFEVGDIVEETVEAPGIEKSAERASEPGKTAVSAPERSHRSGPSADTESASDSDDPVIRALESELARAVAARRWADVAQLGAELDRRRSSLAQVIPLRRRK